jgi:hypothetical protein
MSPVSTGLSFSVSAGGRLVTAITEREDASSHARLAPSAAARWIACPGSVQAQAEVFDPTLDDSNPDSRLGVAAHALLEACLITSSNPEAYIGAKLAGADHPTVDEDMCDWVRVCLDYVGEYLDTFGEETVQVYIEKRVYAGPEIGITGDTGSAMQDTTIDAEMCNGTGDVIIAHRDKSLCVVIDYKNGVNKVHAKENPQCMLYAAGARNMLGKFRKYRNVIVQPRAGKRSPVDEWECSDATLRKFLTGAVRTSARAALLPNAPRTAGNHCQWCKASARCRTRKDKVFAIASVEFANMDDEPDPERLTDAEFLEALDQVDFLQGWINSVQAHALRMVEQNPAALPGWRLGWTKRTREWDDPIAVIEYCRERKLNIEDYSPRELLSPAQMEKMLRRRRPTPRRKRGEPAPPSPVQAFVKYSIPSAKLLRAEDPAEDFGPLEDE